MNKNIILASSSPRRKEILKKMGLNFEIKLSDYEEFLEDLNFSYEKIEVLALNKAKSVLDIIEKEPLNKDFLIISADTVVILDEKILTKPKNKIEAVAMLKKLSGRKHSVVTSHCIISTKTKEQKIDSDTSYVEFNNLDDELIIDYVERYKPLDKAGSYGIQELPGDFIKKIEGSFENIMGLSPDLLNNLLNLFDN